MKSTPFIHYATGIAAAMLVVPTIYFLSSAFLYYNLGVAGPWKLIEPIFESPANKDLGLNINLLIVFGPLAACIIALFHLVNFEVSREERFIHLKLSFFRRSYYWVIVISALLCIGALVLYFLGENCNCH
jgi:hypothetical protein